MVIPKQMNTVILIKIKLFCYQCKNMIKNINPSPPKKNKTTKNSQTSEIRLDLVSTDMQNANFMKTYTEEFR